MFVIFRIYEYLDMDTHFNVTNTAYTRIYNKIEYFLFSRDGGTAHLAARSLHYTHCPTLILFFIFHTISLSLFRTVIHSLPTRFILIIYNALQRSHG
jgi:hypothetical protein